MQQLASQFTPTQMGQMGIAMMVLLILAIIIGSIFQLSILFAIGKSGEKPGIGKCLRGGLAAVIPVFLIGVVAFAIIFGGSFLFIIPGILIELFFQFVNYELVLGGKKWFGAVTGSVQIMSQHFGEVVLRMLVFFGSYYLLIILPFSIFDLLIKSGASHDPASAIAPTMIIGIIRFVISIVAGFYSLVYGVVTYQHAKLATDTDIKPQMAWIWVTSILGWMIAILIGSQALKALSSPYVQDQLKSLMSEIQGSSESSSSGSPSQDKIEAWKKAINADARPYYDESVTFFKEMKAQSSNPTAVKKLDDQNIAALQKAIALDGSNPELWSDLASAYTWVNSKGTLQDALKASEKAESLDPATWTYTYGTAEILLSLKRYDDAILKLQQVLRANDNYARAHIALGEAYYGAGMKESAKTEIQKGIDIFTKYNDKGDYDADILQARKTLENIK